MACAAGRRCSLGAYDGKDRRVLSPPIQIAGHPIPSPATLRCYPIPFGPFLSFPVPSRCLSSYLISSPGLVFRCPCEQQGMVCRLIFSVAVTGSQLSVAGYIHTYIHTYIPVNRSTLYDAGGRDVDGWVCEKLQRWKRWGWRSWTLRSGQVRPAATRIA